MVFFFKPSKSIIDFEFESIFQNTLSKALKYKHPDRNPVANVTLEQDNNNQVLKIEYNGICIDLEKYGDSILCLHKTFHHNTEAEGVGYIYLKIKWKFLMAKLILKVK